MLDRMNNVVSEQEVNDHEEGNMPYDNVVILSGPLTMSNAKWTTTELRLSGTRRTTPRKVKVWSLYHTLKDSQKRLPAFLGDMVCNSCASS